VSGARSVSLHAPCSADSHGIFLFEGEPPLPEHADAERAEVFASRHRDRAPNDGSHARPWRIESDDASGWLIAVRCAPFGRQSQEGDRRKSTSRDRRAGDRTAEGSDDTPLCWIGLRFGDRREERARSDEAFLILTGSAPTSAGVARDQWASLLSLGGVLSWYARQISSLLDDPVTGLAGRAEFQSSLSHAFFEARESGRPLSLLFINPDDFTSVNERFGHETGDRVLREIGDRLRAAHRSSDAIAKYGGAIFASFFADTDLVAAKTVAGKVWSTLAESPYVGGTLRLGISVGFAVFEPEDPGIDGHLELIRRADKALNAAKRYGGDHVTSWKPEFDAEDLGSVDRMTGVYTGNMAKDYRNMTLLSDTMTVVAGSADVEELVEQVVERLLATLKADAVGIFEFDGEGEPILLEGITRHGQTSERDLELSRRGLALVQDAQRERKAMTASIADDGGDRRVLCFAAPLLLNEVCLGCLYLDGREETIALEGAADLGFLRAFATQLAVALDRARLSGDQKRQQEREQLRLRAEVDDLRRALHRSKLVYRSREMENVLDTVRRVAPTQATVLVIGESGTGKELVARTIHELSPFRKKPLVVVDCGAIPMTLIESELFGHERGAYTGAQERRIGRLLEAEGGTVVLDEIGELPLEVQSKLLRFVQERQIVPVGGTKVRHVDTRLIAVTNRELSIEAAAGRFREDLYYRLNVVRITVPPLRERPEDIPHLALHFLDHFAQQYQKGALRFSDTATARMLEHAWPGNVRDLQNRIMQAVILCEGSEIGVRELELEHVPPEQTVEMDLSAMKRAATVIAAARATSEESSATNGGARRHTSVEAWEALRLALRRQVAEAVADDAKEPLPIGSWLDEDLVLQAYETAGGVSGRARVILGVPETTFRRKLQKATSRERAGILTRRPPWNEVHPRITDLVRTLDVAQSDVLHLARSLLLQEVVTHIGDPARGAALMGVTVRTFRRWAADLADLSPAGSETPLAPAV
jgi:diguanylate cyclase (GGDEF)-like protein